MVLIMVFDLIIFLVHLCHIMYITSDQPHLGDVITFIGSIPSQSESNVYNTPSLNTKLGSET